MTAPDSLVQNLTDDDLQDEIELVGDLVVAASSSNGPLTQDEIDAVLGVLPRSRSRTAPLRPSDPPPAERGRSPSTVKPNRRCPPGNARLRFGVDSALASPHGHFSMTGDPVGFRLTPQDTSFYDLFADLREPSRRRVAAADQAPRGRRRSEREADRGGACATSSTPRTSPRTRSCARSTPRSSRRSTARTSTASRPASTTAWTTWRRRST